MVLSPSTKSNIKAEIRLDTDWKIAADENREAMILILKMVHYGSAYSCQMLQ